MTIEKKPTDDDEDSSTSLGDDKTTSASKSATVSEIIVDMTLPRPANVHKLMTKEDGHYGHVHKIIGTAALVHYGYRTYLLMTTGSMQFDDSNFTLACILLHERGQVLAHLFVRGALAEVERTGGGDGGQHLLARWHGCDRLKPDAPLAGGHGAAHDMVDHAVAAMQVDLEHAAAGALEGGGELGAGGDGGVGHGQAQRFQGALTPHGIGDDRDRRAQAGVDRVGCNLDAMAAGARLGQEIFERRIGAGGAGDGDYVALALGQQQQGAGQGGCGGAQCRKPR